MKILMISAEGPPLQRAGALVDVMDSLPGALRARGHEVSVAVPFYREIKENRTFKNFFLQSGGGAGAAIDTAITNFAHA